MNRNCIAALRAILAIAAWFACAAAVASPRPIILVLGDSLSAEYGLQRDTGWVKLLAARLASPTGGAGQYSVVNASISGETSSGGRTRLPGLLKQHAPGIVVIALGANDGLRGLPVARLRENLQAMISACRAARAQVLLVGIRIPPNYGREYTEHFAAAFIDVARAQKIPLVPFLLDGFADQLEYFQADRIHPTERAQQRMLDTVWRHLRPLLAIPSAKG
jgi:acyl-CoA thioesterase I